MKIKLLLTIASLLYNVNILFGQLNIQFNAINEYAFNSREALNLTVINPSAKSFDVVFDGKISSGDGQIVVEFKTNPVRLNPGANIMSPLNIGFRDLIYINTDIAEIELKTGTFPSGNYSICIWSACVSPDCDGAGQFAGSTEVPVCTQLHVENPTPLLLANPDNEAEIEETRPLYTWIPPAPVAGSASLNYTMKLVEVLEGQSKADALNINRALIEMPGIGNPMLMHPSDLPALEAGKTYAWQVEAFVGRTSIAKSEQWKFKVKKEIVKKDTVMYAVVSRNMDAGFYKISEDGFLYFIYHDPKPAFSLNYEILMSDLTMVPSTAKQIIFDKEDVKDSATGNLEFIGYGKFKIDISSLNLKEGYYYLHIISQDKEHFYLKFFVS